MSIPCASWLPNRNLVARCLTALSWLLACGCSDDSHRLGGERQATTNGARMGLCANGAELETIDQMEDGDGTIDMIARRGGVWVSFNDMTPAATQIPSPYAEVFPMEKLDPPRSGSHFAAHTHGGGFTNWGAGIGFELYNQQAYDVSQYAGITFWARGAADASVIRFEVTDVATAPRGGQCQEDAGSCSDHFGSDLSLGTSFRRYSFTWQELTQRGWGWPLPPALDTAHVYGIHFQTDPVDVFDFWIDDIAFLCHPE